LTGDCSRHKRKRDSPAQSSDTDDVGEPRNGLEGVGDRSGRCGDGSNGVDGNGGGSTNSIQDSATEKLLLEASIDVLEGMGFARSSLMQQLLTKYKENIESVITELLQSQGGEDGGGAAGARDNGAGSSGAVADAAIAAVADAAVNECVVCMESEKSHILVPCGHQCVCEVCAVNLVSTKQACPVCRAPVLQVIKVYL